MKGAVGREDTGSPWLGGEGPSLPCGQVSSRRPLPCWSLGQGRWDKDLPMCARRSRGGARQAA